MSEESLSPSEKLIGYNEEVAFTQLSTGFFGNTIPVDQPWDIPSPALPLSFLDSYES
mgnify:FL=1